MERRAFIKRTLVAGLASGIVAVAPSAIAKWSEEAFKAKGLDETIKIVFGDEAKAEKNEAIKIKAPEVAENGAVVPVTVTSEIEGTESISLFITENPTTLAGTFHFGKKTKKSVKTRLKMGKTTQLVVVVKAGDKLYQNTVDVKVTKGGCGG